MAKEGGSYGPNHGNRFYSGLLYLPIIAFLLYGRNDLPFGHPLEGLGYSVPELDESNQQGYSDSEAVVQA